MPSSLCSVNPTHSMSFFLCSRLEYCCFFCTRRRLSFDKFSGSRVDPLPRVVLHQIKRSSKSRYKYEVRRLKCREQFCEKMAAALASSNSKSFWQQVHRVNKSNKPPPVPSVDGVSGSNHISQLFFSKLERLLNSQPSTGCDSLRPTLFLLMTSKLFLYRKSA